MLMFLHLLELFWKAREILGAGTYLAEAGHLGHVFEGNMCRLVPTFPIAS